MTKKIAVLLEEGFEEIEAIVPIDVLRRLEFNLSMAGVSSEVTGAHGVRIRTDFLISEVNYAEFDAVILPGGMPGSANLKDNSDVISLVKKMYAAGKITAAICAAPIVFAEAGIMTGKRCTGYPMPLVREMLADADYTGERVEIDGTVITGKGPGAAYEFAVAVASALGAEPAARTLMKNMFVKV